MEQLLDGFVHQLLQQTERLEDHVIQNESDPDQWLVILDSREELIEKIQDQVNEGIPLTETNLQILSKVHEINERLVPNMLYRKNGVQNQLNNIQRSKLAINTYNEAGPSAYGAFLDRKK